MANVAGSTRLIHDERTRRAHQKLPRLPGILARRTRWE
jgi:hypothetical protein